MSILHLEDEDLKMLHETLCVAEHAVWRTEGSRREEHANRIGRILKEIERQRPLGSNGKHGKLHTPTCGCEDK